MGSIVKIAMARLHDFWSRFLLFYPPKRKGWEGGVGGLPAAKQKERGGKTQFIIIDGWEANGEFSIPAGSSCFHVQLGAN
jgi:hypothetical protein